MPNDGQPMDSPELSPASKQVQLRDVSAQGLGVEYRAEEPERDAIAQLAELEAVDRFEYQAKIIPLGDGSFELTGNVVAEIIQNCVVSLEPIKVDLQQSINLLLVPADSQSLSRDADDDPEARDVEIIEGDGIDLGQLAYEHLVIGIDPYPRAGGLAFEWSEHGEPKGEGNQGAFASLQKLKLNDD